ncbi:hypothetical protein [Tardiphaga sp. 709]|jgi:hypothetical protein|uniref:hypothetical protein n=1 Tax=unclassified Tardiphaga TaxID=2631404 RepID=UPI0028E919D0|nr:hypothetical protein [Tardiphaga sp. 709]WNV07634.1 hypothetical protein RSO67_19170 [Tardiphaga sp. 709]
MDLPGYLAPAADASLGTTFVRVTTPDSPMGNGMVCKRSYCTHRYSSAQAWNANQSLLLIVNGCNGLCFLDGRTYAPLFRRQRGGECEWHPQDPELMICVAGRRISRWSPRSNAEDVILETEAYRELQFGPYKGNPSWDGNRIVVRAISQQGTLVAFALDLSDRRKFPDIDLARIPGKNSYCGISPLGKHIFCQQSLIDFTDQAFVFSIEGDLLQSWTEHHRPGHGDMTVDIDGYEVYVGISKSAPDKYQVIKRRLQDGQVTALAPYGEAQHASMRAIRRPGWVFMSYAGAALAPAGGKKVAPFAQEVIALKIDGSGEFRRIAHTRNAPYDYWSETHGSPSPDGSQVIWSSNWGQRGGPVFDFVSRIDWSDRDSGNDLAQGDRHEGQQAQ